MNLCPESLFQTAFELASTAQFIVQADAPYFTIAASNEQHRIITGNKGTDLCGQSVFEAFNLNQLEVNSDATLLKGFKKAITSRKTVKLPSFQYLPATGLPRDTEREWWQLEITPFIGAENSVTSLMCTTHNITGHVTIQQTMERVKKQEQALQREQALNEELAAGIRELAAANGALAQSQQDLQQSVSKLAESEGSLRSIFEQAPLAMCVLRGREMVTESANNNMLELWDKKSHEVIGFPLKLSKPALQDQMQLLELVDGVYATGKAYKNPVARNFTLPEGKLAGGYYNYIFQPLKNEDNLTTGVLVILEEVSERVQAGKVIERGQQQFRQAVESAGMGTWSIDPHSGQLSLSDRSRELLGFDLSQKVSAAEALQVIDLAYQRPLRKAIVEGLNNYRGCELELLMICSLSLECKWLRMTGKMFFTDSGKPAHFSGVLMDVTERKLDDMRKNDFITIVSHELKTPLTILKSYVQMLSARARKADDSFAVVALEKGHVQVKKMTTLINSFLNVSRLDSGKILLDKTEFQLDALIREKVEEAALTVQNYDIYLRPCGPLPVCADQEKIGQVITNLISNAVKYSPVGRQVEISCFMKDKTAVVSVKDAGMGIKKEDLSRLFERFYRVTSSQMQVISGFGIGLYLCSEIILRHEGRVNVESEFGKGSTFYFSLPLV